MPESLLDLAFQAIKELTSRTAEQWTLLELLKEHPRSLLELSSIMRRDHGYTYGYISKVLSDLVRGGLAVRPNRQGRYEPHYNTILSKMIEVLEVEEGKVIDNAT